MSVPENNEAKFDKEYLEEGITRLKEEDEESPTPENETAINLAEEALEDLGEEWDGRILGRERKN